MSFTDALKTRTGLVERIGEANAHLVLAIALFLEEPDVLALASEGLTDGGNDKKIDFMYHDKDARRLVFAQGYLSTKAKDSAPANKASDLNTAAAWIFSGDLDLVPEKLQHSILGFRAAIDRGEIDQIDLLYVHNLPESINVARELQTTEKHIRKLLDNPSVLVKAFEFGGPKLDHLFSARDSHIEVTDKIEFPSNIELQEAGDTWSAGVATVTGEWIAQIYSQYGEKLYSANYRGFLGADGRKRVNSGIRETISRQPGDFWAYNNGITILTLSIEKDKVGNVILNGISIINGAQTTGTIGNSAAHSGVSGDVRLLSRIIECSDQTTIDRIVRFNNTQNQITTWDRFSNDADQRRLFDEFQEMGFGYNRKRGFSADGDQIGIEQVLQPILAFHGRPRDAVRGKAQLFLNQPIYRNVFENKKARHLLFAYTLSRAIDAKRLELKEKSTTNQLIQAEENQLLLLKNLNFKPFLIAAIANSLEAVVGRRLDPMTVAFQPSAIEGVGMAELTARWLPVVEAMLPLLSALPGIQDFYTSLTSDDSYLDGIKSQLDAMLIATRQPEQLADFSATVADS